MQKVYQRINWENDPSTNTPLSEDNLNKMDYALDKIDDRVVQLGGYQDRVAQSEKNAKTSETNAKASETNAKQSEVKAKQYMENAFSGTPEGYAALVEQVGLLDIMKSTAYTYPNTKQGGLRLLELVGATVQNGEPSPSNPIAIENVGDCVELAVGYWETSGNFAVASGHVSNKRKLPCKHGDVVAVTVVDGADTVSFRCYGSNGANLSVSETKNGNTYSFTAPSGAKEYCFIIVKSGVTLKNVGKITITVNGKNVVQIVEHGKNCLMITAKSSTTLGVYFSVDKDKGTIACKGTSTGGNFEVARIDCKKYYGKKICLSGCPNVGSSITYWCEYVIIYNDGTPNRWGIRDYGNSNVITIDENMAEIVYFIVFNNGYTANNLMFKPQLEIGDKFTGFEPYTEKVATIFLDEPLREGDRLVKVDGVFNHNHKCGVVDLGTLNWAQDKDCSSMYYAKYPEAKHGMNTKGNGCYCTHYTDAKKKNIASWTEFCETNNIISCGSVYINHEQKNSAIVVTDNRYTDVTEFKNAMNGVILEYELAEETLTPLDAQSQIALNGLETFKDMTYLEVDSKIKPSGIEVEYGTSQVTARMLKNELRNDTQEILIKEQNARIEELAVALVSQ